MVEQLLLDADLCAGQESEIMTIMRKRYSKEALVYHITDIRMPDDIIVALIRLLTHIYIDQEDNRV
jgi:hypothetical protein